MIICQCQQGYKLNLLRCTLIFDCNPYASSHHDQPPYIGTAVTYHSVDSLWPRKMCTLAVYAVYYLIFVEQKRTIAQFKARSIYYNNLIFMLSFHYCVYMMFNVIFNYSFGLFLQDELWVAIRLAPNSGNMKIERSKLKKSNSELVSLSLCQMRLSC